LTKTIRSGGALLAKISIDGVEDIKDWHDPNADHLVKQVLFNPLINTKGLLHQANHLQAVKV
jgi:hypothetical protein